MSEPRRHFELTEDDRLFLEERGLPWEAVLDGKNQWVIVHEWPVPGGYNHRQVSLACQLPSGYPDAQIDMVFVRPDLQRADGKAIKALINHTIVGETWQRWSRHRTSQHPWRPRIDSLESHLALVNHWFVRELERK